MEKVAGSYINCDGVEKTKITVGAGPALVGKVKQVWWPEWKHCANTVFHSLLIEYILYHTNLEVVFRYKRYLVTIKFKMFFFKGDIYN